jgi:hypothetical protein
MTLKIIKSGNFLRSIVAGALPTNESFQKFFDPLMACRAAVLSYAENAWPGTCSLSLLVRNQTNDGHVRRCCHRPFPDRLPVSGPCPDDDPGQGSRHATLRSHPGAGPSKPVRPHRVVAEPPRGAIGAAARRQLVRPCAIPFRLRFTAAALS